VRADNLARYIEYYWLPLGAAHHNARRPEPALRLQRMIVGTAGYIDHGKTDRFWNSSTARSSDDGRRNSHVLRKPTLFR